MDRFHVTLLGGEMNRFHIDAYLPAVAASLTVRQVCSFTRWVSVTGPVPTGEEMSANMYDLIRAFSTCW